MKNLIKLSIFIFTLLCSESSFSKKTKLVPNNDFPHELSILISAIQDFKLNQDEENEFKNDLMILDQLFQLLTKEEAYFLSKSEIFQLLLGNNFDSNDTKDMSFNKTLYSPEILKKIDSLVKKRGAQYNKFSLWLLLAVKTDLEDLFSSSIFHIYLKMKRDRSSKPFEKIMLKKMDKKFDLLLPWYQAFASTSIEEFNLQIKKRMLKLIKQINESSKLLINYSRFKKFSPEEAKNYKMKLFQLKEQSEDKLKNILPEELIIDAIKLPQKEDELSTKTWKPKDN